MDVDRVEGDHPDAGPAAELVGALVEVQEYLDDLNDFVDVLARDASPRLSPLLQGLQLHTKDYVFKLADWLSLLTSGTRSLPLKS